MKTRLHFSAARADRAGLAARLMTAIVAQRTGPYTADDLIGGTRNLPVKIPAGVGEGAIRGQCWRPPAGVRTEPAGAA